MPESGATRGKRLLSRLNQPVDPGHQAPGSDPEPVASTQSTAAHPEQDAHTRTHAKSAAHYQRRLRNAHTTADPTALLMAHVDRIRALKNPALTRAAADALAALISQNRASPNRPGQ